MVKLGIARTQHFFTLHDKIRNLVFKLFFFFHVLAPIQVHHAPPVGFGKKKCYEMSDQTVIRFQSIPNSLRGGAIDLFFGEKQKMGMEKVWNDILIFTHSNAFLDV